MNVQAVTGKAASLSIGVIGDLCLDAYYFLSETPGEMSVETGKSANSVEKYYVDPGAAANVALDLKRLGTGRVEIFGVMGDDFFGEILARQLERAGVVNRAVVQGEKWATHVYGKIYESGEEKPRLDIGDFNIPSDASVDALLEALKQSLPGLDAVIINEQVPQGIHNSRFQRGLCSLIEEYKEKLWFCDCRNLNDLYNHTIRKLNVREAAALYVRYGGGSLEPEGLDGAALKKTAAWLFDRWKKPVLITRGADGVLASDGEKILEVPGLHIVNKTDPVGAGDAFLAALTLGLCLGQTLRDAMELGNFSAGVSVQKLFQTGRPGLDEIAAIGASPDYRYNPELAGNPQAAMFIPHTSIEIITRPSPETPGFAVFDHDGTISTLRLGWEAIMEETMLRSILGTAYGNIPVSRFERVRAEVRDFISRSTGVQTLVQMEGLRNMVENYGFVPPAGILDPAGYKKIYNERLLDMVEKRVRRLGTPGTAAFSVEDFTIKGAVPFLRRLHKAGVRLYLASGTDAADVRREAELLGYAAYFTGIYGAVGDTGREPKKEVFQNILARIGENPQAKQRCVVFGDGPVELREARKNAAAAIGLVSDEVQRFGINSRKRNRLILAGADLLIPDYTEVDELMRWTGWNWGN
ncbi:MAG: PfkB family carbohydrate kinase [Treponema sp.]|jgi:sugar/nucleoside kinase (ribokinase family)/phosphoglycolate phosphatase-like HAD superfamily hydrolase|nr:PfkB family carbohydrate kinase [Treponema sp.]